MTYAFVHDVPINRELYGRVKSEIGNAVPSGLLVHLALETEGGLRYVDVWKSEGEWDRFHDDVVHPALERALGFSPPPGDGPQPVELVEAWIPSQEARQA